ncbi:MAG TPA: nucleotide sugar dehydrogenase, partial [Candidatus Binatus sp.]|nr:nucleotide sugar dehydrogenase [Candidatus Binatus sp.]
MRAKTAKLKSRIRNRSAKICIVGLGYVGVPLTVASARAGFDVVGVDTDPAKVASINKGVSHVEDPFSEKYLPGLVKNRKIRATTQLEEGASEADVVVICVQTPLDAKGVPDLSYVKKVTRGLARTFNGYSLIILESTSYPGTTEEIVLPILQRGRPRASFGLVYSPERIDYGNPEFTVSRIPKVVGGIDDESTNLGADFYSAILEARVFKVSSPSVAEASKMLENIFRYV